MTSQLYLKTNFSIIFFFLGKMNQSSSADHNEFDWFYWLIHLFWFYWHTLLSPFTSLKKIFRNKCWLIVKCCTLAVRYGVSAWQCVHLASWWPTAGRSVCSARSCSDCSIWRSDPSQNPDPKSWKNTGNSPGKKNSDVFYISQGVKLKKLPVGLVQDQPANSAEGDAQGVFDMVHQTARRGDQDVDTFS